MTNPNDIQLRIIFAHENIAGVRTLPFVSAMINSFDDGLSKVNVQFVGGTAPMTETHVHLTVGRNDRDQYFIAMRRYNPLVETSDKGKGGFVSCHAQQTMLDLTLPFGMNTTKDQKYVGPLSEEEANEVMLSAQSKAARDYHDQRIRQAAENLRRLAGQAATPAPALAKVPSGASALTGPFPLPH